MKMERHSKIVELIGKYEIETQEELAEYLNKEGYNVTQATVSRDIRELKLSKIQTENGGQKYAVFHPQTAFNDKYTRILHDSFVSMDMAQNILVIKTVSGMAMAVAAAPSIFQRLSAASPGTIRSCAQSVRWTIRSC